VNLQEVFDQHVASFQPLLVEGFVSAVARDTLTERQLGIYLAQDIHYLEALARSLFEMKRKFSDFHTLETLDRHSVEAMKSCSEMRRLFVEIPSSSEMARDPIRPTTYAYI
jgi:thiaminase